MDAWNDLDVAADVAARRPVYGAKARWGLFSGFRPKAKVPTA
jgi:hypothetical protein